MAEQTFWDLEEELKKNAPKAEGLELEKVIGQRTWDHLEQDIELFVPITPDSDFKPADQYKDAVKGITPAGVDEKYRLLASVAKLATARKSRAVIDLKHYTHAGIAQELEKHKGELEALKDNEEKYAELEQKIITQTVIANLKKNKDALTTILKNTDAAFAHYTQKKGLAIATPGIALKLNDEAENLHPDMQEAFMQNAGVLGNYLKEIGTNRDLKNYAAGKRVYVAHYKTVKNEETEEENKVIDYVEVWKKKEN